MIQRVNGMVGLFPTILYKQFVQQCKLFECPTVYRLRLQLCERGMVGRSIYTVNAYEYEY